jgi:hypothetical protein
MKTELSENPGRSIAIQAVLVVLLALVVGLSIGSGTALVRARHTEVPLGNAKVEVDSEMFDFGEMDFTKDGSHDFSFTNTGTTPLKLVKGHSSCKCTVGEIADSTVQPGDSTTVHVTWKSKHVSGGFQQNVSINTNDPNRREIVLTIKGEFTEQLRFDPNELNFGQLVSNKPESKEARILCNLPSHPLKITEHEFMDHDLAKFFTVETSLLAKGDLPPEGHISSGALIKVTVKPGLPPGRFQQRILLKTNLSSMPEVELPVFGSMGKDVSVAGSGWDDDIGVLTIGPIKAGTSVQRQLLLFARGLDAKNVRYNIVHVEPDFLKVKLGETTVLEDGKLSKTSLTIEIPKRSTPANYLGDDGGKAGEIKIDTTSSDVHQVRMSVRFAIQGGKEN